MNRDKALKIAWWFSFALIMAVIAYLAYLGFTGQYGEVR